MLIRCLVKKEKLWVAIKNKGINRNAYYFETHCYLQGKDI